MSKRKTVLEIAQEAKMDPDEALINLWDANFDYLDNANSLIHKRDQNRARRALGLGTKRELQTLKYWKDLFKSKDEDFLKLLKKLEIKPEEKKLTKKAINRLKNEANKQAIDPLSGSKIEKKSDKDFEWHAPGHTQELRLLNEKEIKDIHFTLVADFLKSRDPIEPPGIRDKTLFGSAVFRPHTAFGNTLKYPTVESSAATLLHSIILNHPFHNGNKRTALVAMLVFLDENGFIVRCNEDELFKLTLLVAKHKIIDQYLHQQSDREILAITNWLLPRVRYVSTGDHTITGRKLFRILKVFKCDIEKQRGNNKYIITRQIITKGLFGLKKSTTLISHLICSNEGKDLDIGTIKRIREELCLDNDNGTDSKMFYEIAPAEASDFISKYRKILQRLAKF